MNFLAHIFLSYDNEELLLGNFMADFISNKQVEKYSDEIKRGILLHRLIDTFTDNHPIVRQGTKRLRKKHGKYAPVVIDILYDNILAKNWHLYDDKSLEEFAQDSYLILYRRLPDMPDKLRKKVPLMVADNFLLKYRSKAGIERALASMDRRTKFPSDFKSAALQLDEEEELFTEEFNIFFPELIQKCNEFLASN
ncbi:acyl carrier protein phosphodiesterase [Portibacter lacus]|uniref:ACP phosphodiesterase n=1 Tax=Portibacter lacus TaxID=1099794 RepID=A0AA37WCP9_9BACT|nr:ACP phosphodiesterase [Portibacter lacus]GLR16183.1 ACP phosphodiesterase [Portibacter lacus]